MAGRRLLLLAAALIVTVATLGLGASAISAQTATSTPQRATREASPTRATTARPTVAGTAGPTALPRGAQRAVIGIGITDEADGVRVGSVATGGPGETAGIRVGDYIVAVDGQDVTTSAQVQGILVTKQPGDSVSLSVRRGSDTLDVTVTLAAPTATPTFRPTSTEFVEPTNTRPPSRTPRPTSAVSATPRGNTPTPGTGGTGDASPTPAAPAGDSVAFPSLGFSVQVRANSFLVTEVAPGSAAAQAGLQVNDAITSVNGQRVSARTNPAIIELLNTSTEPLRMGVVRGRQSVQITLTPGAGGPPATASLVPSLTATEGGAATLPATLPPSTGLPPTLPPVATVGSGGVVTVVPVTPIPGEPPILPPVNPTPGRGETGPNAPRIQLGVIYEVVTPQLQRARNLPVDYGALVMQVIPGSAAEGAGIQPGDLIIAVDGDRVDARRTLALRMLPYYPGDTVTLTIVRGGQVIEVPVVLVNRTGIAYVPPVGAFFV